MVAAPKFTLYSYGMGTARLQMGIGREIYASLNKYGV
jgi:hypothetical protein